MNGPVSGEWGEWKIAESEKGGEWSHFISKAGKMGHQRVVVYLLIPDSGPAERILKEEKL
jgi:hypothetical protein